jgi:hypothetical protein
VHTKTTHKEQPAICLWQMSGGPNSCHRQPRLQFVEAKGKSTTKRWQHVEDQIEDLTTQLSNIGGHNGNGSRNLFAECRTHRHQHLTQAHDN